jgi:hypothetical protein
MTGTTAEHLKSTFSRSGGFHNIGIPYKSVMVVHAVLADTTGKSDDPVLHIG